MNSRYLLLSLLVLLISFNACKKTDNDEAVLTNPSMLLKTATQYQDGQVTGTTSYEYDNSGRITKISYNGNRYEKYSYVSDTMILKEIYNNVLDHSTDTLLLNDRGLVTAVNRSAAYEYDAEGYLVKSTIVRNKYTYITINTIADGNMVETTNETDSLGILMETANYRYNYNATPAVTSTIGDENTGIAFYGKQSKNLPSGCHYSYSRRVDHLTIEKDYTFMHILDRYHRVVRKTQVNNLADYYTAYTYSD